MQIQKHKKQTKAVWVQVSQSNVSDFLSLIKINFEFGFLTLTENKKWEKLVWILNSNRK